MENDLLFDNSEYTEKEKTENETTIEKPLATVIEETKTETASLFEPSATETSTKSETEENTTPVSPMETTTEENKEVETEEQKKERKKGSGRKPLPRDKDGNIIREETEAPKPKKDGAKDLNDLLSQYADDKPTTTASITNAPAVIAAPLKPQLDVSKFINGAVFLIVMDAVFPSLILFLMEFANPKYAHVKESARKKLKLDKDEKQLLEEGANEIVKYIFADANPLVVFTISVGFIYYGKVDALEPDDFLKPISKPTDKKTNGRK